MMWRSPGHEGVNSARSLGHAEGSASAMLRDDATGAGGIAGWAGRTDKGKKRRNDGGHGTGCEHGFRHLPLTSLLHQHCIGFIAGSITHNSRYRVDEGGFLIAVVYTGISYHARERSGGLRSGRYGRMDDGMG